MVGCRVWPGIAACRPLAFERGLFDPESLLCFSFSLEVDGGEWRRCRARGWHPVDASFLQDGQAPATLQTLLPDVLLADPSPQNIVVCQGLPSPADLSGATERLSIEVSEDLECRFGGEDCERVDADELLQLLAKER